jgi:hypothetical protein
VRVQSSWKVWAIVAALLGVVASVTAFGLRRVEGSLDTDKEKALKLAGEFVDCLYREDVDCLEAVSVWDDTTIQHALERAKQIRSELGARGQAAPIQNTWSMRKFSSLTAGVSTMLRFSLATAYANDADTREWFELIEKGGMLRVQNFRVSSPKLPEQAKLVPSRDQ